MKRLIIFLICTISCFASNNILTASSGNSKLIQHSDYSLEYSEEHEQAKWVAYYLSKDEVNGATPRKDDFRADPKVVTGSATPEDYKGSGFDRGHLAPAADMKASSLLMSESFFMSNMSPQRPKFNRGKWRDLEIQIREWAKKNDGVYVITGPVLNDIDTVIGKNKVSVPKYYYKAIYNSENEEMVGFLMPNKALSKNIEFYAVTVDSIESFTGLDLFVELENQKENQLESEVDLKFWFDISNDILETKYSINKKSGIRHNSSCKAFNCKNCTPCTKDTGRPCNNCGG